VSSEILITYIFMICLLGSISGCRGWLSAVVIWSPARPIGGLHTLQGTNTTVYIPHSWYGRWLFIGNGFLPFISSILLSLLKQLY
jgi:hypothetical protein